MRWGWCTLVVALTVDVTAAARAQPPRGSADGPVLVLGGDVLWDGPTANAVERHTARVGESSAFDALLADVAPTLRAGDLAIINLETPVASRVRRGLDDIHDFAVFAAPAQLLRALRDAGVDAVWVANNHSLDQRREGLAQTLQHVREAGLTSIGAGASSRQAAEAVVVNVAGARVALAAWTQDTNYRPLRTAPGPRLAFVGDETLEASLAAARRRADLVVASFHWTIETGGRASPREEALVRRAAEAGADLIVAHGPHVPLPVETLHASDGRRVVVLYSLGNLVASMEREDEPIDQPGIRDAPVATVHTRRRPDGHLEVAEVEVETFYIARPMRRVAWWPHGQPLARPLRIGAELDRIAAARCGPTCDMHARLYRRRRELIERAMFPDRDADNAPSQQDAAATATLPVTIAELPVAASAPAPDRGSRTGADGLPVTIRASPEDLTLRERYERGAYFPLELAAGAALETTLPRDALDALVALLRDEPALRVQITGHAAREESDDPRALAFERARRLHQLLVERGVEARRVQFRAGPVGGRWGRERRVIVRLGGG